MKKWFALAALIGAGLVGVSLAGAGDNRNYGAHLTGDAEVPARDTQAQGQVILNVNKAKTEVSYKLIASNIDNVVGAHIHTGPAGVNGPVLVGLFAAPLGGGPQNGVLAEGTITGPVVPVLIGLMNAGNAYVNVHTNDGVAPTNTGPGDFPGGEIRGQIK